MKVLVLSGGGAKGADQAGRIKALHDMGHRWDAVVGVSVGAVNAWGLSMLGADKLKDLWFSIKGRHSVVSPNITWPWKFDGIYQFKPLRSLIESTLKDKRHSMDCYAAFTDFKTGFVRYEGERERPTLSSQIDAILASCAVAGIEKTPIKGCYDGGHKEFAPVSFALDQLNAERVDLILTDNTSPTPAMWEQSKYFPIFSILMRALGIMIDEVALNDWHPHRLDPRLNIYAPKKPLEFGSLDYHPDILKAAYHRAYAETRDNA